VKIATLDGTPVTDAIPKANAVASEQPAPMTEAKKL